METLIDAIEYEKFAQVKTIVYRSPELLTQTFNRNGKTYTPIELAEEYARKNTHKNAIAPEILKYLKRMLPVPAKVANAPTKVANVLATLRNLQNAVQRSNLSSVIRILNANPDLIKEEYYHASGEPYTILKTAQEAYPNNDSVKIKIINALVDRGAHLPPEIPLNYAPSNQVLPTRKGLPPLYPRAKLTRKVPLGIATKLNSPVKRKTRRRKN
jgi:hypothetical protein